MDRKFTLPTKLQLAKVLLSAIAASCLGCGKPLLYHMKHYRGPFASFAENTTSYYHSPKTGKIIEKDPCASYCEPPCFGYVPTTWTHWPSHCPGNFPVQGEVVESTAPYEGQIIMEHMPVPAEATSKPTPETMGATPVTAPAENPLPITPETDPKPANANPNDFRVPALPADIESTIPSPSDSTKTKPRSARTPSTTRLAESATATTTKPSKLKENLDTAAVVERLPNHDVAPSDLKTVAPLIPKREISKTMAIPYDRFAAQQRPVAPAPKEIPRAEIPRAAKQPHNSGDKAKAANRLATSELSIQKKLKLDSTLLNQKTAATAPQPIQLNDTPPQLNGLAQLKLDALQPNNSLSASRLGKKVRVDYLQTAVTAPPIGNALAGPTPQSSRRSTTSNKKPKPAATEMAIDSKSKAPKVTKTTAMGGRPEPQAGQTKQVVVKEQLAANEQAKSSVAQKAVKLSTNSLPTAAKPSASTAVAKSSPNVPSNQAETASTGSTYLLAIEKAQNAVKAPANQKVVNLKNDYQKQLEAMDGFGAKLTTQSHRQTTDSSVNPDKTWLQKTVGSKALSSKKVAAETGVQNLRIINNPLQSGFAGNRSSRSVRGVIGGNSTLAIQQDSTHQLPTSTSKAPALRLLDAAAKPVSGDTALRVVGKKSSTSLRFVSDKSKSKTEPRINASSKTSEVRFAN